MSVFVGVSLVDHFLKNYRYYFLFLLALGTVQGFFYASTVVFHPDHGQLLYKGIRLAELGVWTHYGNAITGGGFVPGSLSTALVGIPLMIYDGMASINISITLLHLAAILLLNNVLKEFFSPMQRLVFLGFFWLSPWRASKAVLWNPSYLIFASALHLWSAQRMSLSRHWVYTFLNVIAIAFAFQLHASSIILALVSLYLVIRRHSFVNFWGLAAGVGLSLLSLYPYFIEMLNNPALAPVVDESKKKFFYGKSLLYVYPFFKGLAYWIRYTSLMFPKFVYAGLGLTYVEPEALRMGLAYSLNGVKHLLAGVSFVLSFWSFIYFLQKCWRQRQNQFYFPNFLQNYLFAVLLSTVFVTAISPTEFSHWHLLLIAPFAYMALIQFHPPRVQGSRYLKWGCAGVILYMAIFNTFAAFESYDHHWRKNLGHEYPYYKEEALADMKKSLKFKQRSNAN